MPGVPCESNLFVRCSRPDIESFQAGGWVGGKVRGKGWVVLAQNIHTHTPTHTGIFCSRRLLT